MNNAMKIGRNLGLEIHRKRENFCVKRIPKIEQIYPKIHPKKTSNG